MSRLGLWGEGPGKEVNDFADFNGFMQWVVKRGPAALELVAMDLKVGAERAEAEAAAFSSGRG